MDPKKASQQILGFTSSSPSTKVEEASVKDPTLSDSPTGTGLQEISPLHSDDIKKLYKEDHGFHMYDPSKGIKYVGKTYGGSKDKGRFAKGTKKFVKSVFAYGAVVFTLIGIQRMLSTSL